MKKNKGKRENLSYDAASRPSRAAGGTVNVRTASRVCMWRPCRCRPTVLLLHEAIYTALKGICNADP